MALFGKLGKAIGRAVSGIFGKMGTTEGPRLSGPTLSGPGLSEPPLSRPGVFPRTGSSRVPEQWKPSWFPDSPLGAFLMGEEWLDTPESSNVLRVGYQPRENGGTLKVVFKDLNEYHYWPVSPQEAESMYNAPSHGSWIWDNLRIRKTLLGHQKSYVLVKGHGEIQRKWIQTPQTMTAHLRAVGQQSADKGSDVVGVIPENVPFEFFLTEMPAFTGKMFK